MVNKAHPIEELAVVDADAGVEPPVIEADTHYLLHPEHDDQIMLVVHTNMGVIRYQMPHQLKIEEDMLHYDLPHVVSIIPKTDLAITLIQLDIQARGFHRVVRDVYNEYTWAQAKQKINIVFHQKTAFMYER